MSELIVICPNCSDPVLIYEINCQIFRHATLIESGQPGLNADTSIEDVARSLAGLAAGDGALAGQGYERLVTRWRRVAAFEQAM